MKIQLASDLHLEFLSTRFPGERLLQPAEDADVLVLAGDVGVGVQAIEAFADWPVPVLLVAGNHEAYGQDFAHVRTELKRAAAGTSVQLLDNEVFTLNDVRFLGSTLWTDYKLHEPRLPQRTAMVFASQGLNDHRRVRWNGARFAPSHALSEHLAARLWLQQELERPFDGTTVVITHHGPHPGSVHLRYMGDPLTPSFVSDLSDLVNMAHVWVHGHVHDSFDYSVGRCRVVANPLGYPMNTASARTAGDLRFENQFFQWNYLLEV